MRRYIQIGDMVIGKGEKYIFDDISTISDGGTSQQENVFAGTDGAEYSQICFEPRVFEVKGTILAETEAEMRSLRARLIYVCNPKLERDVYYFDGCNRYYCRALADGMPKIGNRYQNSYYMPFVIYLKIPKFYWQSDIEKEVPIYGVVPVLSNAFTFPGAFSTRISKTVVTNDGETALYPKIILTAPKSNSQMIELANNTTGQKLKLDHTMSVGEVITIDMYDCTIYSNISGDLINKIDRLDNFWALEVGANDIEVTTTNIIAVMYYRVLYSGV